MHFQMGRMPLVRTIRNLPGFIFGMVAAFLGPVGFSRAHVVQPSPSPRVEALTMSAFIARIRHDAELRARFAQAPRAVLREFGIDPAPIVLPEELTEAQISRLVDDWAAGAGSSADARRIDPLVIAKAHHASPPTAVYGPPPAPAPVYGPPPTPRPSPTPSLTPGPTPSPTPKPPGKPK